MQHQGISPPLNGPGCIETQQHQPQMDRTLDMNNDSNSSNSNKGASISSSDSSDEDQIKIKFEDWGFKVDRLFEVAYRFYKRNESKAFHPSFDERNKMIALIMQAKYGNCDGARAPDVGVLDLVGRRRQYEWSLLKGMSKTEAMSKFIYALDDLCPIFKAHAEAVKISSGYEQNSKSRSELSSDNGSTAFANKNSTFDPESNPQMHNIYSSLCKQTYNQFKSYAEAQCPKDLVKQKNLISSLQEQYYQQYMSQMYPETKDSLPNSIQTSNVCSNVPSSTSSTATSDKSIKNDSTLRNDNESIDASSTSDLPQTLTLVSITDGLATVNHEQAQKTSEIERKSNDTPDSVMVGVLNCDENSEQADISCEELNSAPIDEPMKAPSTNSNLSSANHSVNKLDTKAVSPNTSYSIKQTLSQNIVEPDRLHQNIDLPPIGIFESFPEPKPVSHSHRKCTTVDQINPNVSPASLDLPATNSAGVQQESDLAQDDPSTPQQNGESSVDATYVEQNNTYIPISVPTNDNRDLSQLQHDHSLQESSTFPLQRLSNQIQIESDYHQNTFEAALPDETLLAPSTNNHDVQRVPELWNSASSNGAYSPAEPVISYEEPEPATIWSKRGVAEFKESLGDDKQGGVYEIKEGTLVVIQVPTYPDGKYIYWEFATDDYDIGFGVDFVYEKHLVQPIALNIYEDMDDDDMESMIEGDGWPKIAHDNNTLDPELGRLDPPSNRNLAYSKQNPRWQGAISERDRMMSEKRQRLANTISILPTYRRDCHEEVFVGRHRYPGEGYYLLKFDNTYSVLRSKSLYFRICYFM